MKKTIIKLCPGYNESKRQHLEFLQNNIARMNQCSFSIKGWCIAILSAFLALYASTINETSAGNPRFIYCAIAPTFLFWILDAMYLAKERKFIAIYNDVIGVTRESLGGPIRLYEIPLDKYTSCRYSVVSAMFSPTEICLYLSIIVGLVILAIHI